MFVDYLSLECSCPQNCVLEFFLTVYVSLILYTFPYFYHIIERFVFSLYDKDESGAITGEELLLLVKDLFGGTTNNHVKAIISEIPHGIVYLADFQFFLRGHSALMLPASRFQTELRRSTINEHYWKKKTQLRKKIPHEKIEKYLTWGRNKLLVQGEKTPT